MKRLRFFINGSIILCLLSCNENRIKSEFKNGKLYEYEYFKNGQIRMSTPFLNDTIKDGIQKKFYQNGKTESEITWSNNRRIGETIDYYASGRAKLYKFYNFDSHLFYQREYDTVGKIIRENGEVFPLIIMNLDRFEADSTLSSDIYIVQPPKCEVTVKLFLLNTKDTIEVPFKRIGNFIRLNEKIPAINRFNKFALKQFAKDFDQNKQWEHTKVISL